MQTTPLALYRKLPLRGKLILWYTPILLATIAITGYYAYSIASGSLVDKTDQEQQRMAAETVMHLDYFAQDAIDISNYLFLSQDIQSLLVSDRSKAVPVSSSSLYKVINRLMVTRAFFQFLTIYSDHFAAIEFNNKGLSSAIPFPQYKEQFDYDTIMTHPSIYHWDVEVPGQSKKVFYGDNMNKLLLTAVLKNEYTLKPEGLIILGVDEKDVRQAYVTPNESAEIIVVNNNGRVLSDSSGKWVGSQVSDLPHLANAVATPEQFAQDIDRKQWLFAQARSELTGWHVFVIQPKLELLDQLNRIKWITVAIMAVTFLCISILSWWISTVITGPIRRILVSMKRLQRGDFSQRVTHNWGDEIGQLGTGYNIMVSRIQELIDDVYLSKLNERESELKRRNAELSLLQSQMNPHFLYNTLNTISWTAHRRGDEEVAEMIYSLSNLLRISLSGGKEFIRLHEEISLVEKYLFLQQMRFANKLVYEIHVDEEAEGIEIPKLIIQPFVENAIVHGIEPLSDDAGLVQLQVRVEHRRLMIEITDDGAGMSEARLQEVRSALEQEGGTTAELDSSIGKQAGSGFALQNVWARLRLIYGESADIEIHSVAQSGTRVRLYMPLTRER